MKDFLIAETSNNFELVNHDIDFTSGLDRYAAQKLRLKLTPFKGEYFLDSDIGLPYPDEILVKNPNIGLISDLFKAKIREVEEVSELTAFNLEVDSALRLLVCTFTVRLTDGSTVSLEV